jgi:transposase-like protein
MPPKKYRRFSATEKLSIVEVAKTSSISNAAKLAAVDRSLVRAWMKSEAMLKKSPYKNKRSRAPMPLEKRKILGNCPELPGGLAQTFR